MSQQERSNVAVGAPIELARRRGMSGLLWRGIKETRLWIGGLVLVAVTIMAIAAPLLAPHDPEAMAPGDRLARPFFLAGSNPKYVLGSDFLGRDIMSRLIYGARISLMIGVTGVVGAGILGVLMGAVAGFYGKWVDEVIMRIVDVGLSIPFLLLALTVVLLLGPGLVNVIVVLSIAGWMEFARVTRAAALKIRKRDFVEAAHAYGASDLRIIFRHMIPNLMAPILVIASQRVGIMIYTEASLSFLGLGVPVGTPTWGSMIADGRGYLAVAWWLSSIPGIALTFTVLASFFVGDGLRDILDPRLRR